MTTPTLDCSKCSRSRFKLARANSSPHRSLRGASSCPKLFLSPPHRNYSFIIIVLFSDTPSLRKSNQTKRIESSVLWRLDCTIMFISVIFPVCSSLIKQNTGPTMLIVEQWSLNYYLPSRILCIVCEFSQVGQVSVALLLCNSFIAPFVHAFVLLRTGIICEFCQVGRPRERFWMSTSRFKSWICAIWDTSSSWCFILKNIPENLKQVFAWGSSEGSKWVTLSWINLCLIGLLFGLRCCSWSVSFYI